MATPVIISKDQFKYEFTLARDGDNATRSFTIDTNAPAAALSAAIELQGIFAGSASSPFNLINPNQLIQPAGWRDNDPDEDPWTTAKVGLVQIHTDETYYGELPEGGGDEGEYSVPNLSITSDKQGIPTGSSATLTATTDADSVNWFTSNYANVTLTASNKSATLSVDSTAQTGMITIGAYTPQNDSAHQASAVKTISLPIITT